MEKTSPEYLTVSRTVQIPYRWSAGPYLGRFFRELRDNAKIVANKCPRCDRVLFPPRIVCGKCHVGAADEWVELGPKGVVHDYTKVYYPMTDPATGKPRPEPYVHATIELDGGGLMQHYLEEPDIEKVKVGMRVEAVFKPREERRGSPLDIKYFATVEDKGERQESPLGIRRLAAIKEDKEEIFQFPGRIMMDYKYTAGSVGSKFLAALRDKQKIMAIKCPKCNRVYVPPRLTCKECFSNLDEWVELSGKGTVNSYTVVYCSEPFHPTEPPLSYGLILLDGADTGFLHLIGDVDPERVRIGMRVEPVFKAEREGSILDIEYFKPLPG